MKNIWTKEKSEYAEFSLKFVCGGENTVLKITACHNYVAYLNGEFVANGQYADIPEYKCFDSINLTGVKKGENELFILATTTPDDFSTARVMPSFVAFEIIENEKVIACSDENISSRKSTKWTYGDRISNQLGQGYKCDFTAKENPWEASVAVDIQIREVPRPIKKTELLPPTPSTVSCQGVYKFRGGNTVAEKMQLAWLSSMRFAEMTGENRLKKSKTDTPLTFKGEGGDGVFVIFDLGRTCSGYPLFSVTVDSDCEGALGWGEHLSDLRIRTEREGRNFASKITLKSGINDFEGYLRRLGCRYLCLFIASEKVTVNYFSFREERYPFKVIEKDFGDGLLNKIYSVSKRTLELCAHEHYEDCPWREQALYGMDSRNQMLFGYSAFEEYELPRASLRLLAYAGGEDGLLALCAPARSTITIPAFSLYWVLAVCENAERDYDEDFVNEMLPYAEKIMQVFENRTADLGVNCFVEPRYWNFHEWSDGMDGEVIFRDEEMPLKTDGALTVLTFITAKKLAELENRAGFADKTEKYSLYAKSLESKVENFYDCGEGLYASYIKDGKKYGYHGYTQALALCSGVVPNGRVSQLCEELETPRKTVEMTFACLPWKYDALIKYEENGLEKSVDDIREKFGKMIYQGATSFWETAEGEADFNDAGSLCHGWSSVACYVFDKYLKR